MCMCQWMVIDPSIHHKTNCNQWQLRYIIYITVCVPFGFWRYNLAPVGKKGSCWYQNRFCWYILHLNCLWSSLVFGNIQLIKCVYGFVALYFVEVYINFQRIYVIYQPYSTGLRHIYEHAIAPVSVRQSRRACVNDPVCKHNKVWSVQIILGIYFICCMFQVPVAALAVHAQ